MPGPKRLKVKDSNFADNLDLRRYHKSKTQTIIELREDVDRLNERILADGTTIVGKDVHSSTSQLNLSALYGIRVT